MYPAGGYISAEKAKGEKNMNLEEFKKALSSDATEENKQLKKQLSDLQEEYGNCFQTSKVKTIPLKKVVGLCVIDALLLQKG